MPNRNLLTRTFLVLALSGSFFSPKLTEEQFATLTVTKIERAKGKEAVYKGQFRIKNIGDVPIFCPGIGIRKPIDIDTLDIEMQQPDGSWKPLPEHRELPALEKVKIGAHEEYDNEFWLENPYPVSEWMAFPRKPYSIPLRGKLRLSVGYFVSEKEWENYVSAHMRNEGSSARSLASHRQAHSEPFTLPEVGANK